MSPDDPLLPAVAAAQATSTALSAIITDLKGPGGESDPALQSGNPSGRTRGQLTFQGGLLYSQGRLRIPPTATPLIMQILQQYLDSPLAGHYRVAKTQALVAHYYIWLGMATAVDTYVRSCDSYAQNKVVRHAPYGLLSPLPIPTRPWSTVSLDWITHLPPSHYHDAILMVVDRLTKHALFVKTLRSMSVNAFRKHIHTIHNTQREEKSIEKVKYMSW